MTKSSAYVIAALFFLGAATIFFFNSNLSLKDISEEKESKEKLQNFKDALAQEKRKTQDPSTGIVPRERLLHAQKQISKYFSATHRVAPGIQWTERGPDNIGGRTRAILFDRNDNTNNTVFAGSVSGGLWKNTNISGAGTWSQVSGVLENMAISCIVQDQVAGFYNTMYFGTGETWGNLDAMRGLGIFKSTDGGASWSQVPSTNNADFYYVQKIVINSSHEVFAATSTGLYKSVNGGTSWSKVLSGNISDVEVAANDDLYAGDFYGKVYKSTNGGSSWTNNSPSGAFKRIEITTAPSNSSVVYLLCQGANSDDVTGIFQSTNGGSSWTSRSVPTIVDQGSNSVFTRSQAWYDLIAAVDPNNASTVFIGGVDGLKSADGGATWQQVTTWSLFSATGFTSNQLVHADHHAIVFAPGSSSTGILGTDGGLYYSTNLNVTSPTKPTYTMKNTGYNVTQYYGTAIHPTSGSNFLLGGAQDNGSHSINSSGVGSGTAVSGGDGAFCHINQTDGVRQVTSYVYNTYYRSTNSGSSFTQVYSSQTRGSFINPTDYDSNNNFLYGDGTDLVNGVGGYYFRINMGTANPTPTATYISVTNFSTAASVTFVQVSPVTANRVYFGLSDGSVGYVNSANTATSPATGTIIKTGVGSVSGIAIDPANENHMLVTYSNYGVQSVFESTNALNATPTWTNIENNLPDMPVRWVIFYPGNTDRALLATELGVWSTDDLNGVSTEWTPTNIGLANTRVDMLKVRTSDNTIVAATHGRGIFTTTISNTPLPTVQFQNAKLDVSETYVTGTTCGRGYRDVTVTMTIGAAPTGAVTATISPAASATATNNQDFQLLTNTVTFASGSSTPQSITVRIFDDAATESTESIPLVFNITSGSAYAQTGQTSQTCQVDIADNDNAPGPTSSVNYTIGSFDTNLGASSPLQATQSDKKIQYLYKASELTAAGLQAGLITSLKFVVNTKGSSAAYNGFTIKMGHTSLTDLSAGFAATTGFTTVYSAPVGGYSSVMGENIFSIPSFTWDGTSNILIEFCYDNSAVGAADDVLDGQGMGYTCQARRSSTTTSNAGCGYTTGASTSVYRPLITFTQDVAATTVATVLNTTRNVYLGPNETIYVFDAGNRIVASIQNLSSFDYGCTSVTIDRAGTGSSQFWNTPVANNLMNKTIRVVPTNNNPAGQYTITLYFTQAEVQGWETATGQTFSNIQMVKYSGAISDITPSNTQSSSVNIVASPTRGTLSTSYTLSATFTNGFSGFGAGIPGAPPAALPVTYLSIVGKLIANHGMISWQTSTEFDNKVFEIEKSTDGMHFKTIGSVSSTAMMGFGSKYTFTDPEVAGSIQYYRIKQIDFSGSVHYSDIVEVRNNNTRVGWISNPFGNQIQLQLNKPSTASMNVQLLDMNGRLLLRKNISSGTAATKLTIDVSHLQLAPGVYTLILSEGASRSVFKLVHAQ